MDTSQYLQPMKSPLAQLLVIVFAASAASCALHGPDATRTSSLAYNDAVQNSQQREILLNIVRMRFLDSPQFLTIESISTQMEFQLKGTLSGEFGEDAGATDSLVLPGGAIAYTESPTLTFTPRQDNDFARDLMTPVDLETLYLLLQFNWAFDNALLMLTRGFEPVASGTSSIIPRTTESDDKVFLVAQLLTELLEDKKARLTIELRPTLLSEPIPAAQVSVNDIMTASNDGYRLNYDADSAQYVLTGEETGYALRVDDSTPPDPRVVNLIQLLGLPPGQSAYHLSVGNECCNDDMPSLRIETRSMLEVLSYLSGSVQVPGPLIRVTGSPDSDGEASGQDVLHVHASEEPPDDAFLSVPYRGFWFYIADTDTDSKETLVLLSALMRLTLNAKDSGNAPILTLPVGG